MKKKSPVYVFSKRIYPVGIVKKAARQYAKHVELNLSEDDECTYVEFQVDDMERETVNGEFGNYVLYLTREGRSSK